MPVRREPPPAPREPLPAPREPPPAPQKPPPTPQETPPAPQAPPLATNRDPLQLLAPESEPEIPSTPALAPQPIEPELVEDEIEEINGVEEVEPTDDADEVWEIERYDAEVQAEVAAPPPQPTNQASDADAWTAGPIADPPAAPEPDPPAAPEPDPPAAPEPDPAAAPEPDPAAAREPDPPAPLEATASPREEAPPRQATPPREAPRYNAWLPTPDLFALTLEPTTATELETIPLPELQPVTSTDLVPATSRKPNEGLRRAIRLPNFLQRTQLRRRIRYLRHLREVQLRDLGGFALELHRFGAERPELVRGKLESAAETDRELRQLENAVTGRVELRMVREAGIGGACVQCGAVHGSEDRFCSNCGGPLPGTTMLADDGPAR
jgi:hypothetical protein